VLELEEIIDVEALRELKKKDVGHPVICDRRNVGVLLVFLGTFAKTAKSGYLDSSCPSVFASNTTAPTG
jgi:hypothetical protein